VRAAHAGTRNRLSLHGRRGTSIVQFLHDKLLKNRKLSILSAGATSPLAFGFRRNDGRKEFSLNHPDSPLPGNIFEIMEPQGNMETPPYQWQQEKLKILFVEDDPESTELFVSCFDAEYNILCAASAEEALDIFRKESDIAMVLSDQNLPGINGVDLLSRIYAEQPEIIRIIITGYIDISDTIDAINKGHIYQFILKPWDIVQMRMILARAAHTWVLTRENHILHDQVLEKNRLLTATNEQCIISEKNLRRLSTALLNAREDEQKRIAMELHDELGQSLAALKLQIRVLKNEISGTEHCVTDKICEWLDRFRSNINEIIENVRRLSRNLSPVIIDDLGLDAALENIVQNFTSVYGISCSFQQEPLAVIKSADGQRLVYRLVQETLNNIGKHSQATTIDFIITSDNDQATLKLTDNGKGFDFDEVINRPPDQKGIGLTAMTERVKMLGGTLDIQSNVGRGTTVVFTIPLDFDLSRDNLNIDNGS
jgi:signal transduction histidine kinase